MSVVNNLLPPPNFTSTTPWLTLPQIACLKSTNQPSTPEYVTDSYNLQCDSSSSIPLTYLLSHTFSLHSPVVGGHSQNTCTTQMYKIYASLYDTQFSSITENKQQACYYWICDLWPSELWLIDIRITIFPFLFSGKDVANNPVYVRQFW